MGSPRLMYQRPTPSSLSRGFIVTSGVRPKRKKPAGGADRFLLRGHKCRGSVEAVETAQHLLQIEVARLRRIWQRQHRHHLLLLLILLQPRDIRGGVSEAAPGVLDVALDLLLLLRGQISSPQIAFLPVDVSLR